MKHPGGALAIALVNQVNSLMNTLETYVYMHAILGKPMVAPAPAWGCTAHRGESTCCVLQQAQALVDLLQRNDLRSHINLIPWNPVTGLEAQFQRPSNNAAHRFNAVLQAAQFASTIRATRGLEASAACGQLRNISVKDL